MTPLYRPIQRAYLFPGGARRVVEFFDFRQGEPNASVFAIPENYTIEMHPTIDTRPRQ